ncbi:hypothetical protein ACQP04_34840 [Pseudonocardia halophobica]|uniref:SbtR family transcriptional regulator n=1 Tax=Pseudonocardia halophobica TaxID=29401 RepID=UPI003D8BA86F
MADFARAAEEALAEPDPWTGFRAYVLTVLRMQAADRGLADLLTLSVPAEPELAALRGRVEAGLAELVDRAQRSGDLRADVTPEDLRLRRGRTARVGTARRLPARRAARPRRLGPGPAGSLP